MTQIESFDPQYGYEKPADLAAEDRFRRAAWNFRLHQWKLGEGGIPNKVIDEYNQAREVLQDAGWSEDGLEEMERVQVRLQSGKWKVMVV